MKACIVTLGCKVNQYESFALYRRFSELGYDVTENEEEDCDLYVLNTCAVTAEGERKSRQVFHRIRRRYPNARVVVCGCASQNHPERFEGAQRILGTGDKFSIPESKDGGVSVVQEERFDDRLQPGEVRTRAYVKIQDGCNNFCSYCIVPYLRGRSRSRSKESAYEEIRFSRASEIVLTGINLSDYGRGIGTSLADFLEGLSGMEKRIRLGSLEVNAIDERLLEAASRIPGFCPQFHLSLQSGSDAVLSAMNRRYTAEEYLDRCQLIRRYFPDAALTTDVIVGFPTESDADFDQTCSLCESAGFFEMHIFPYSRREGTKAAQLPVLDPETIRRRLARLHSLQDRMKQAYLERWIGRELEVLAENETFGHARNYIGVYGDFVPGTVVNVSVVRLEKDGVFGKPLK